MGATRVSAGLESPALGGVPAARRVAPTLAVLLGREPKFDHFRTPTDHTAKGLS
jgi:hypothetical protein